MGWCVDEYVTSDSVDKEQRWPLEVSVISNKLIQPIAQGILSTSVAVRASSLASQSLFVVLQFSDSTPAKELRFVCRIENSEI
jgi:hypothetical protein